MLQHWKANFVALSIGKAYIDVPLY